MHPAGNEPTDVLTRDDCEDAVALPITPKTRLTVIYSSGLLPSTGSKKTLTRERLIIRKDVVVVSR